MGLENMYKKRKKKEKSHKKRKKNKDSATEKTSIKKKQIPGRKESYEAFNKNTT